MTVQQHPENEVCKIPPSGWTCTRAPGHEGPCAAVLEQAREMNQRDQLMIELAYCRHVQMSVSEMADRMLAFFNQEKA